MIKPFNGIVLRTFSHDTMCIFSESMGKFFCNTKKIPARQPFIPGSFIKAHALQKPSGHLHMESINEIVYPTINNAAELTWLHHILELYYFFLPELQPSEQDFYFLDHYLILPQKNLDKKSFEFLQQLAVGHFLTKTGFFQHPTLNYCTKFFEEVIDPKAKSEVPLHLVKDIEEISIKELILRCLQEHPDFSKFKTIPFLYGASTQ